MLLNQFRSNILSKIPFGIKQPAATRRADVKVRLRKITNLRRATAAESVVVELLSRTEQMDLAALVRLVAEALYREELRAGAWAVDVGLFGCGMFVSEAQRILKAGDGELWKIG